MTPHEIAARHALHRSGREWRGDCRSCGYHDGLSVRAGRTGSALIYCHARRDCEALAMAIFGSPARPDPAAQADRAADRLRKQQAALRLWALR